MTAPRYQDVVCTRHPGGGGRRRHARAGRVRRVLGSARPGGRRGRRSPAISTCGCLPGQRKTLPVDTRRNAFAYVFEGSGSFRDASPPRGVLVDQPGPVEHVVAREQAGDRSLVLFGAGDEVTVQAGERGHPLPARLGQAARGAGRVVRPDRDEHRDGAAAGVCRARSRDLHPWRVAPCGRWSPRCCWPGSAAAGVPAPAASLWRPRCGVRGSTRVPDSASDRFEYALLTRGARFLPRASRPAASGRESSGSRPRCPD